MIYIPKLPLVTSLDFVGILFQSKANIEKSLYIDFSYKSGENFSFSGNEYRWLFCYLQSITNVNVWISYHNGVSIIYLRQCWSQIYQFVTCFSYKYCFRKILHYYKTLIVNKLISKFRIGGGGCQKLFPVICTCNINHKMYQLLMLVYVRCKFKFFAALKISIHSYYPEKVFLSP